MRNPNHFLWGHWRTLLLKSRNVQERIHGICYKTLIRYSTEQCAWLDLPFSVWPASNSSHNILYDRTAKGQDIFSQIWNKNIKYWHTFCLTLDSIYSVYCSVWSMLVFHSEHRCRESSATSIICSGDWWEITTNEIKAYGRDVQRNKSMPSVAESNSTHIFHCTTLRHVCQLPFAFPLLAIHWQNKMQA